MRAIGRAVRQLARTPSFTLATTVSVALGVAAPAALFTATEALLLKPLPLREPDRLIQIAAVDPQGNDLGLPVVMLDGLNKAAGLDGTCGFLTPLSTIEIRGSIAARSSLVVSGECLATLGVLPAVGRLLAPADDRPGAPPVAVVTYETWVRDFAQSPSVIGQQIRIEGRTSTIVGVTERGFRGLLLGFPAHVIYPLTRLEEELIRRAEGRRITLPVQILARIPRADTLAQVTARLGTMWPDLLEQSVPIGSDGRQREAYLTRRLNVRGAATGVDYTLRKRFNTPLVALLALSGLVLLISFANVANLLLARGTARRGELALRAALGAGRWRLVREELIDAALLLAIGVGAGLWMAYGANRLLVTAMSSMFTGLDLDLTPDARAIAFTSILAACVFAVVAGIPTWHRSRSDPRPLLGLAGKGAVGRGGAIRSALVVTQVALALALVTLAVLCAGSLVRLRETSVGFDPNLILSAQLMRRPDGAESRAPDQPYYSELAERLARAPGVEAVALARSVPFFGRPATAMLALPGRPDAALQADATVVTDDFFQVLRIPIVAGRNFSSTDGSQSAMVAIISESLSRKLFPQSSPVGTAVRVAAGNMTYDAQIVGIAQDAVLGNPRDRNILIVYLPMRQRPDMFQQPSLLVRTAADPAPIAASVRSVLQSLGREYPTRIRTLREERNAAVVQEHVLASISLAFAAVGLVLAAVGLFGVLNLLVANRRSELAVRMALGAGPGEVVILVVRRALTLVALGTASGIPLAWAGTRTARTMLPGLSSLELLPVAVIVACLLGATLLATWLPARRAAAITPLEVLRGQ